MSATLDAATEHQARARVALSAALAAGPSHAYLFRGPRGAGKRAAARVLRVGGERCWTPRRTPTSSGWRRAAPSIWSRRCASG